MSKNDILQVEEGKTKWPFEFLPLHSVSAMHELGETDAGRCW